MNNERLASVVIHKGEPRIELLKIGRDRLAEAAEVIRHLAALEPDPHKRVELTQTAGRIVDTMRRHAPAVAAAPAVKRSGRAGAAIGRDKQMPRGDR